MRVPPAIGDGCGAATPLVAWKMGAEDSAAGSSVLSARKLGAALWRSAAAADAEGGVRWKDGLFGRLGIEFCSSMTMHRLAMEGSRQWDYCHSKALDRVSLKNSKEIATAASSVQHKPKKCVFECTTKEVPRKKINRPVNKSKVPLSTTKHQKTTRNLVDDIRRERKNCQMMDATNSKLLSDIARTKSSARRFMQGLEKEKRARRLLENACEELARKVEGSKAEITALRDLRAGIQEAVGKERKVMQIAEAWKEERVQEKLVDARLILEGKYDQVNGLIAEVEAFLRQPSPTTRDVITLSRNASRPSNISSNRSKTKDSSVRKSQIALPKNDYQWETLSAVTPGDCPQPVLFSTTHASVHQPRSTAWDNPHVIRAMKGHIEWPRGIQKHGLAAGKLLEARLESQRVLMRNVLKQRS